MRARLIFLSLLLCSLPLAARAQTFSGGTLTVSFSAYAILDDDSGNPGGGAPPQAVVQVQDLSNGTIYPIRIGGRRSGSSLLPAAWSGSGGWNNISGAATPSLGTTQRDFVFQISLPPGNYFVSSQSGAYGSTYIIPPQSQDDPPERVTITDSYFVTNLSIVDTSSGSGSGSGGAQVPLGATYTVTWSAATGGAVTNNGTNLTVVLPASGGQVGVTATAQSPDGGIIRRLQIVRTANGQVLADVTGSAATLSASALYSVDFSNAPDTLRAVATVDGRIGTQTGTGLSFPVDVTNAAGLRYMVQFEMLTDTDGQAGRTRGAPIVITNSLGQIVWQRATGAGVFPPNSGVIVNPNLTGGFQVLSSGDFLMLPMYASLPVFAPGTYTMTVGSGYAGSQDFSPQGRGNGRILTENWIPADSAVIGPVDVPGISAVISLAPPSPTPSPTPTPQPTFPPTVQWCQPVRTTDVNLDANAPSVQTQQRITITAVGRDTSVGFISPVRYVEISTAANTYTSADTQRFPAVSAAGDLVLSGSFTFYVRFPLPNSNYPTPYTFHARAVNINGEASPTITLTLAATDRDITNDPTTWNTYIVDYGTSDPLEVLQGNAKVTVVGGIAAMGPTRRGGSADALLGVTPDPNLTSGAEVPPLMPWVIDLRIKKFDAQVYRPTPLPGAAARPER